MTITEPLTEPMLFPAIAAASLPVLGRTGLRSGSTCPRMSPGPMRNFGPPDPPPVADWYEAARHDEAGVGMAGGRHHLDEGDTFPQRLRRVAGVRQVMRASSVIAARCRRIDAWMFARGRSNLLFAALGVLFTLLGLYEAASTRSLVNTLTARGATTSAVVTRVFHLERGRLEASVHFEVHGRQTSEDLALRPPDNIGEGQRVHVVYDPQDPTHVILTSQLNGGHATYGYVLAALAGSVTLACLGRWLYIRHRLHHPVTDRRYRAPWEPSPATRLRDSYLEDHQSP